MSSLQNSKKLKQSILQSKWAKLQKTKDESINV